MKSLLFLTIFLAAFSVLAGQPVTKAQPRTAPAAAAKKPAVADSEIEQVFKAKLSKSKVGANDIQIRVNHGVATLEGRVNVVQHKGAATRMAKSSGATAVINNIKISEAARQKAGQQMIRSRKAHVKSE